MTEPTRTSHSLDCVTLEELEAGALSSQRQAHVSGCEHCRKQVQEWTANQTLLAMLRRTPSDSPLPAIPGYTLIREIYRGGQGRVFEAIQHHTDSRVAIKLLLGEALSSEAARARFRSEIQLTAKLRHHHIVSVFHAGEFDNREFLVMDFIDGKPLSAYVEERKLGQRDIARILYKVACGLAVAHEAGITHRDLKPPNVLVDRHGEPHILDFGIAKAKDELAPREQTARAPHFVGTLRYASPEQVLGRREAVGPASDIYALGVMLFEALTGRLPYSEDGQQPIGAQIVSEPMPPLRRGRYGQRIHRDLAHIVERMLAKQPEQRYPTAHELAAALQSYLRGEPIASPQGGLLSWPHSTFRRLLRAYPLVGLVAVLIGAIVVAVLSNLAMRLLGSERFALLLPPGYGQIDQLSHVSTVTLRQQHDILKLAERFGIAGVDAQTPRSYRPVLAALMRRLAKSNCRVLMADFLFASDQPRDAELRAAIDAVEQAGIPVVLAVESWWPGRQPTLCQALAGHERIGCPVFYRIRPGTVAADLALQRGTSPATPHFGMAGVVAAWQPSADPEYQLVADRSIPYLLVNYRERASLARDAPRSYLLNGEGRERLANRVHLAKLARFTAESVAASPRTSPQVGDLYGQYRVPYPGDAVMAAGDLDMLAVAEASDAQLQQWLGGRIAVMGYRYPGCPDFHDIGVAAPVPGVFLVAALVEHLMRGSMLRTPTAIDVWLVAIGGALAGWALAHQLHSRSLVRVVLLASIGTAAMVGNWWLTIREHSPIAVTVLAIALLVSSELSAPLFRSIRLVPKNLLEEDA